MKKRIAFMAGVALLATAFCVGSYLRAQHNAAPAQPLRTRIALINLNQAIKNYQKYQAFQKEQEEVIKDFSKKYDGMKALVAQWQAELQKIPATDLPAREAQEKKIRDYQRQMQDWGEEAKKHIGKRQDEQAVQLYREVQDAVQHYARAADIELVLHYNDAVAPADLYHPMNVQRKLQMGPCMPIYSAPGMDITMTVADMLNKRYQSMQPAGQPGQQPKQ